jgi:hypothetical protein
VCYVDASGSRPWDISGTGLILIDESINTMIGFSSILSLHSGALAMQHCHWLASWKNNFLSNLDSPEVFLFYTPMIIIRKITLSTGLN